MTPSSPEEWLRWLDSPRHLDWRAGRRSLHDRRCGFVRPSGAGGRYMARAGYRHGTRRGGHSHTWIAWADDVATAARLALAGPPDLGPGAWAWEWSDVLAFDPSAPDFARWICSTYAGSDHWNWNNERRPGEDAVDLPLSA